MTDEEEEIQAANYYGSRWVRWAAMQLGVPSEKEILRLTAHAARVTKQLKKEIKKKHSRM